MGGDGGVVATNRRYLRGAGVADHTGDRARHKQVDGGEQERCRQALTTCALTGAPLDVASSSSTATASNGGGIVACPHGRLYQREAAVSALLRRKQRSSGTGGGGVGGEGDDEIGDHVRGLKDLHPVRFHVPGLAGSSSSSPSATKGDSASRQLLPSCPITGTELNGGAPCYLIVRSKQTKEKAKAASLTKDEGPNVLSERALKEMGLESLQSEYGPFEERDMIRLAPPTTGGALDRIKEAWSERVEEERLAKEAKKGDKKSKQKKAKKRHAAPVGGDRADKRSCSMAIPTKSHGMTNGAAQAARSNVASAVASNDVLSSLFAAKSSGRSDKERRDNLFAR